MSAGDGGYYGWPVADAPRGHAPVGPGGWGGPTGPAGPAGPAGPEPWPPPRPRRRTGRIVAWVAGSLVVLLLLTVVGVWLYVDHGLHRVDAIGDYAGRPAPGAGTNWLIVGSDSRQGLTADQVDRLHTGSEQAVHGGRTDTIMVAHLPDNDTKPTLVSLLRDSYVTIPGHGKGKINSAYALGGPQLLVRTVEQNTGLRIEHYAEIGLGGFASVVDDVGGVRMCLPQPVRDPYTGLDLPAGCQTLDGAEALGYARSRHAFATSDYARTDHQRQFVRILADKVLSPGTLLNPFRSVPTVLDLPHALTVDEGDGLFDLFGLAWNARHATSTAVPISGSVGSSLLWDRDKSQQLFHDLNHDLPVPADLITKR